MPSPHEFLFATIAPSATATPEQLAWLKSAFALRAFRKGQFHQRAGEVTALGGFVVRGLFRTYAIDSDGNESILRFSEEGAWIGDIQSAASGTPTAYFVEAMEPSEALLSDLPTFERMLEFNPDKGRAYRAGLQRSRAAMERRVTIALQATAEERYADFVEHYPSLATRVPQRMLASYLGMTPETLSRIRQKLKRP